METQFVEYWLHNGFNQAQLPRSQADRQGRTTAEGRGGGTDSLIPPNQGFDPKNKIAICKLHIHLF